VHDQKLEPVAYDYVDELQNVLRNQFMQRLHGTYVPSGWEVVSG
jgi:hypothetical protein